MDWADLDGLLRPDISPPVGYPYHPSTPSQPLQIYSTSASAPMEWCSYVMMGDIDVTEEAISGYNYLSTPDKPAGATTEKTKLKEKGGGNGDGSAAKVWEERRRQWELLRPTSLWKNLSEGKEGWGKVPVEMSEEKEAHAALLGWLTEREAIDARRLLRLQQGLRRLKAEMYGAVQMYALVLGVIYVAVANATVLTCEDVWGPTTLALLTTVGMAANVAAHFRRLRGDQLRKSRLQGRTRQLFYVINELRDFVLEQQQQVRHLDTVACRIPPTVYDDSDAGKAADGEPPESNATDDNDSLFNTYLLLAFLLSMFVPVFIASSCKRILCAPCHCR